MTKERLINLLNYLSEELESREFAYCNFNINGMTICFIPRIKLLGDSLYIYSNPGKVTFCIKLYKIEYLHAFTITSPYRGTKELINYNSYSTNRERRNNMTNLEKLKQIEYKIVEEGLDDEGLIKIRRKLYRFSDYDLTIEEWTIKHNLLNHIKELLADDRGY